MYQESWNQIEKLKNFFQWASSVLEELDKSDWGKTLENGPFNDKYLCHWIQWKYF